MQMRQKRKRDKEIESGEEKVHDGRVRIMGLPVRKFKFKYL